MKISVVTICRNDADGLTRTIESVRKQTYKDIEYIITDGQSTDSTVDIIKANSDIIDNWVSEPDTGIYNAMNKSLTRCHGDYVIFMNSGDCFYDANVIEKIFSNGQSDDVVYGDVCFEDILPANKDIKSLQDFFCKSPFCHQGVFAKLESIRNMKFDETLAIVADWAMFTKLFIEGKSFKYVPYVVAKCNEGGVSSDAGRNNIERIQFLESMYSKRVTEDYMELQHLKKGVLYQYYIRIEKTKKLKYYLRTILELFKI